MDLPYQIKGIVKKFSGNGRRLGYPTANIEIDKDAPEGLYFGYTHLEGQKLASIIFIGAPITLGVTSKRAESYILDFEDHDLYGQEIKIEILKKLRDNRKFESVEKLIVQMKIDVQDAAYFFESIKDAEPE